MSDLWWRIFKMKKEAKTPKAVAHKRKYETEYESSPARKKYRRELERERRKRGVAGKGGKDMSHTKTGKVVPEDPHTNRARSHPSVGSTLKMVIVKAPQMNLSGHSAECELCKAPMSGQEAAISNQMFGHSVCTPCIMKEQQEINQQYDMMYHSEVMEIGPRIMKGFPAKFPANCKVCQRYIQQGEEVDYNPQLGGIVCPYDCGRAYIV